MTRLECLIVDDDASKRDRICQVLTGEAGDGNVRITSASSANEATDLLRRQQFDMLVVDVNLPLRGGSAPSPDGGIKLLERVGRGTAGLLRPAFVVGITAYPNLAEMALAEFTTHGWALLTYSPQSAVWEKSLANHCQHVHAYKSSLAAAAREHVADVCIVTALSETELAAVRDLPCGFSTVTHPLDQARYFEGELPAGGKTLRVVATSAPEMGNAAMAATATRVVALFRPKVCLLVGICAGIDAEIGDLAVGEFSLHYDSGKFKEGKEGEKLFQPQPRYQPASDRLLEALRRFKLEHTAAILGIPAEWRGVRPERSPAVHFGPVASGAAVVENSAVVADLTFRDRKLVALEMESYGFYLALRNSTVPRPEFAMIKAACDRARPPKEDRYQAYCAFLSAQFAYRFLHAESAVPGGLFA